MNTCTVGIDFVPALYPIDDAHPLYSEEQLQAAAEYTVTEIVKPLGLTISDAGFCGHADSDPIGRGVDALQDLAQRKVNVGSACVVGSALKPEEIHAKRMAKATAINTLRKIRAEQIGIENVGSTVSDASGYYGGRPEPTLKVDILPYESEGKFRRNILDLAEALACNLAQQEIFIEFVKNGRSTVWSATPRGLPRAGAALSRRLARLRR